MQNSDNSIEGAADYLAIPEPWVRACIRYYAAYPDEVREFGERQHATAAREQELWSAERAALA